MQYHIQKWPRKRSAGIETRYSISPADNNQGSEMWGEGSPCNKIESVKSSVSTHHCIAAWRYFSLLCRKRPCITGVISAFQHPLFPCPLNQGTSQEAFMRALLHPSGFGLAWNISAICFSQLGFPFLSSQWAATSKEVLLVFFKIKIKK